VSAVRRIGACVLACALELAAVAAAQNDAAAGGRTAPAPVPPPVAEAPWAAHVERACTAARLGLRLAAARRVADGGDAAVPAVRAFQQQRGAEALPVALVEALADHGGDGDAVRTLLEDWANDREFFWRAQALRGLALRSARAEVAERYRPLFLSLASDPAWLVRAFAHFGLSRAAPEPAPPTPILGDDVDPRERTKIAALRVWPGVLLEALGDERTFLGDPWGRRRAAEAIAALKLWAGTDAGYRVDASFADNTAAIAQLTELARQRGAEPVLSAVHRADDDARFTGGLEVLSCRNGDLFVRWTAEGTVSGGPTPASATTVVVDPAAWTDLTQQARGIELPPQSGVVICDRLRVRWSAERAQAAVAPHSMPTEAMDWLKRLATAIEVGGEPRLAGALRDRLLQFAVR
jgi:hypothetical protein